MQLTSVIAFLHTEYGRGVSGELLRMGDEGESMTAYSFKLGSLLFVYLVVFFLWVFFFEAICTPNEKK